MTLDHRFQATFHDLLAHFPAVRDGQADAIHDARVATRRLRAIMPLIASAHPGDEWNAMTQAVKRAGRALGNARNIDVAIALLTDLEERSPLVAAAAAAHRAALRARKLRAQRKLIKRLEKLDLGAWTATVNGRGGLLAWSRSRHLVDRVAESVFLRARDAREAIEHASGVYFANRAHRMRVALKKLRYAVELSDESDMRRRSLKRLRRSQETLGQIHDRQAVLDDVSRSVQKRGDAVPSADALIDVLDAECRTLYESYLTGREDLLESCDVLAHWSASYRASRRRHAMLTVGAVALPPAALFLVRHARR